MPESAKNDIIDLIDIVEEGHPEHPNLLSPKSSSTATDDMLDDLDLEKEIDQIFADFGPPSDKGGHADSRSKTPESDALDLDDLFAETGDDALSAAEQRSPDQRRVEEHGQFSDDFEKLFAQHQTDSQDSRQEPEPETEPDLEAAMPFDLVGDSGKEAAQASKEVPASTEAEDIIAMEASSLDPLEASADTVSESFTTLETDDSGEAKDASTPEPVNHQEPAPVSSETAPMPADAAVHRSIDPDQLEKLLQRLDDLESRLTTQEQKESFQPDMEPFLAEANERIAARIDEAMLGFRQIGEQLQEKLELMQTVVQETDSRLSSEMERMDGFEERLKDVFEQIQHQNDGLEAAVKALIDPQIEALTNETANASAPPLETRLEDFTQEMTRTQEQRLEEIKAAMIEEAVIKIEESAVQMRTEMADHFAGQFSELDSRINDLQPQTQAAEEQKDHLNVALQNQEERILETFRQEVQGWRTEWEGQKSALAKDVENSLNYWAKLQDKLKAMQAEWLEMQQTQSETMARESDAANSEELEARFEQLHNDLLKEIRTAVPAAAAQIIREEIQALSEEET